MSEEMDLYRRQVESQEAESNSRYNQAYTNLVQADELRQNLIEWELDFTSELKDIERLLRCDILVIDEKGNEKWIENPDKEKVFMNDSGVSDFLRQLKLLVNKNKVLSNYSIEEINKRVRLIGHEIRTLIYNNYERYGIDNDYKMNNYSMIVLTILSIIEDAYRRALNGETHRALAEQRLVTQTQPLSGGNQYSHPQINRSQKKSNWFNPFSWGRG